MAESDGIQRVEEQNKGLFQLIQRVEDEVGYLRSDFKKQMPRVVGAIGKVEMTTKIALKGTRRALRADMKDLSYQVRGEMHGMKTDIQVLKTGMEAMSVDVEHLKAGMEVMTIDVSNLKTDVGTLKIDVANLKTDMQELRTELKTDMQAMNTALRGDMRTMNDELKADMQGMKTEILAAIGGGK